MRTRDDQLLTTLLLLALIGLVSGMGTNLHSWFGCCCERTFSTHYSDAQAMEVIGSEPDQREPSSSGSECPICTLLARYHATPVIATTVTLDKAMVVWQCDCNSLTPLPGYLNWRRPRGPPSLSSAS